MLPLRTMQRPKIYATEHIHSRVVCKAFQEGSEGVIVPPDELKAGPAVVYGVLRGCGEIIQECQWLKRDFYHIDHGYFRSATDYSGFYRITKNALQTSGISDRMPNNQRFFQLGLGIRPWKKHGRTIVVLPPSEYVGWFFNVDPMVWRVAVENEIRRWTDREIVVKSKDGGNLAPYLEKAWCVVTHSSNGAVDAVLNGVPVITLGLSAAEPVSWGWEQIEAPEWPEREWWAWELANNQWTLDEMRDGTAWRSLR